MGSWGCSSLSLAVEIVEWLLVLSSSESVMFVCDGEEHGLSENVLVMGDEGSRGECVLSLGVVCMVPFRATRCVSNVSKLNTAGGDGPEKGTRMSVRWS